MIVANFGRGNSNSRWTRTQTILRGHEAAADVLHSILQDVHFASLAARIINVPDAEPAGDRYGELDQLLNDRETEAARYEIGKLPRGVRFDALSPMHRYKITRLRAKLALEDGKYLVAGKFFLDAFALQPESVQAKQNRVLGYSLLNDREKAFSAAKQYIAEGMKTQNLLLRTIECVSSSDELDEVMPLIAPFIEADEDINVALTHRLLQFGDVGGASRAADRACMKAPGSPHANFAKAASVHNAAANGSGVERFQKLRIALRHYTEAEKLAGEQRYTNLIPEILTNRGAVNAMLRRRKQASADYMKSVLAASDPSQYAPSAVSYFLHIGNLSSAGKLAHYLDDSTLEGKFLRTLILCKSTDDETSKRTCIRDLMKIASRDWTRAVECRIHCVALAVKLGDWKLARQAITRKFRKAYPFQANTALAWIAVESKKKTAAAYARKAIGLDVAGTHAQDRRLLAEVFISINERESAISLLEMNAKCGVLDDDTRALIDCALHLERHDLLLRICRELRETGEQTTRLRKLEIELLSHYAPEKALELCDMSITDGNSRTYFIAFRNWIVTRLGLLELLKLSPEDLPTPQQISPRQAHLVVVPFLAANRVDAAIRFLYSQLRTNFENLLAHRNYITLVLANGSRGTLHYQPGVVSVDCAVQLEFADSSLKWFVIESVLPNSTRGEVSEGSELGKCLKAKSIGETVRLPGGFGVVEQATVRDIQTKYVRAFQECIEQFRFRFPDAHFIQRVNVGDPESPDLSEIAQLSEKRQEHVAKCWEIYKTTPCAISWLASRLGIDEFRLVTAISTDNVAAIRCSSHTAVEFSSVVSTETRNDSVVLSASAAITLELANAWHLVDRAKSYLVSRVTSEVIRNWVEAAEASTLQRSARASLAEDGRLVVCELTQEQRNEEYERLKSLQSSVEAICTVAEAVTVAAIQPDKRKNYGVIIGYHNLESIALANERHSDLWSDDLIVSLVASAEFNVSYVWTQLALKRNLEAKLIANDEYELTSAKLAALRYECVVWNADTVIRAGEYAQWDPAIWPFKQCIELIGSPSLTLVAKATTLVELLKKLRQSSCAEIRRSGIIQKVFSSIQNPRVVSWVSSRLEELMGDDPFSVLYFRPEFEYWLKNHMLVG